MARTFQLEKALSLHGSILFSKQLGVDVKLKLALLLALSFCFSAIGLPANAIENGVSADGDPRIVSLYRGAGNQNNYAIFHGMCSGYLISERIVATAQHCTMDPQINTPRDKSELYVGFPGEKRTLKQGRHFAVAAVYRADNYRKYDIAVDLSFTNDVAVLVLAKAVPKTDKVKLLNEQEFLDLKAKNPQLWIGGYGLQSVADRSIQADKLFTSPKKAPAVFASDSEYQASIAFWKSRLGRPNYQDSLVGLKMDLATGTVCDGDSGSGFWMRDGNTTTYLGVANGHMGILNCFGKPAEGPGVFSGVHPTYKYQSLFDSAEKFVKENPVKSTITCKKGKSIKKVTGLKPKCPAGYKAN